MLPYQLVKLIFQFFRHRPSRSASCSMVTGSFIYNGKISGDASNSLCSSPSGGSLLCLTHYLQYVITNIIRISQLFKKRPILFLWRLRKEADFQETASNDFWKKQVFLRQYRSWKIRTVIYPPGRNFLQGTPGNTISSMASYSRFLNSCPFGALSQRYESSLPKRGGEKFE